MFTGCRATFHLRARGSRFQTPPGNEVWDPIRSLQTGWTLLLDSEKKAQSVEEVGWGLVREAAGGSRVGGGRGCPRTGAESQEPEVFLSRWSVLAASGAWMPRTQEAPGEEGQSGLGLASSSLQTPGWGHLSPRATAARCWGGQSLAQRCRQQTLILIQLALRLSREGSRRNPLLKTRCLFFPEEPVNLRGASVRGQ